MLQIGRAIWARSRDTEITTGTKCGNLNVCHIFATFFICLILYIIIIIFEAVDGP